MTIYRLFSLALAAVLAGSFSICRLGAAPPGDDGKLRIIVFGAHPDDAEFDAGGTAALWASMGHHVKFVSVTNGDLGHYAQGGGPLARRRKSEVLEAAKILGITSEVLDIHDGELLPTLENRKKLVRLIRDWQADIVIAHRPYDYNPDHRNVGLLANDTAFMVTVPFYDLNSPVVEPNPVYLYLHDGFEKPYPFVADIAVSIDSVFEEKVLATHALASQVYETVYGVDAKTRKERLSRIPKDRQGRIEFSRRRTANRNGPIANRYRDALVKWYGPERAKAVKYAEVFELCEFGRRPSEEEIRKLFPFLGR